MRLFLLIFCIFSFEVFAQSQRNPVIIIPGLLGSELINKVTGEKVWFKLSRSKDDDLRLPISPLLTENRDNLAPGDILREARIAFLPSQDIYQGLIRNLLINGWVEASWENPKPTNAFYVFAYDWRLDNVENAKLLIQKIEFVKWRLKRPNLKFDVIAHSMGGLIAKYAVMYADAELTVNSKPTWAGAKHFRRVFLVGTPSEGSVLSLRALLKGYSILRLNFNINLPFVQNLTVFDLFTIQSVYQLLPSNRDSWIYDETLKPLKIDVYDIGVWETYKWGIFGEKESERELGSKETAREYLKAVLQRAKAFRQAISFDVSGSSVKFFKVGSNCKRTLNSVLIYRDKDEWEVLFEAKRISLESGVKVSSSQVRRLLYSEGDGVVSLKSLLGNDKANSNIYLVCEEHDKLVANSKVQQYILERLVS